MWVVRTRMRHVIEERSAQGSRPFWCVENECLCHLPHRDRQMGMAQDV